MYYVMTQYFLLHVSAVDSIISVYIYEDISLNYAQNEKCFRQKL